jgi:hypothetical protein
MAEVVDVCPLRCGRKAIIEDDDSMRWRDFDCPICGKFRVTHTALPTRLGRTLSANQIELLPYLRSYVRNANEATGQRVQIDEQTDWEEWARGRRGVPVQRKLTKLLELIAHTGGDVPGVRVPLDPAVTAPAIDARDEREVQFLIDALEESSLIGVFRQAQDPSGTFDELGGWTKLRTEYMVTPRGWNTLQPIGGVRPRSCFVAMASHPSLDDAYDYGILKAIEDCGLIAVRVDRLQDNASINDTIIVGIRTAQFGIADVTLQRNGVYFEGGFAMGLDKPVIWMVQEDDLINVHFDTKPLRHVVWKDAADLRRKLRTRIRATIPGAVLSSPAEDGNQNDKEQEGT